MIDLDDTNVEYVRCTCLDRARIALRQTGQHHCAEQMGLLQERFDNIAQCYKLDEGKPVEILDALLETIDQIMFPWILEHGGFDDEAQG